MIRKSKKSFLTLLIAICLILATTTFVTNISEAEAEAEEGMDFGRITLYIHYLKDASWVHFEWFLSENPWRPAGTYSIEYIVYFEDVPTIYELRYGAWDAECKPLWGSLGRESDSGIFYSGTAPEVIQDDFTFETSPNLKENIITLRGHISFHLWDLELQYTKWTEDINEKEDGTYRFYTAKEQGQSLVFNDLTNETTGLSNTIAFACSASGGLLPYSYYWTFGDQEWSAQIQNPTHTYSQAGTYTVSVNVTDNAGFYTLAEKEITVT